PVDRNFAPCPTRRSSNLSHSYTAAGTYTVSLTATNGGGSNTATKTAYISVGTPPPPAPVAAFSGTPTAGTAPLQVAFTDASTGGPTSWSWDFGDSTGSTLESPSHNNATARTSTASPTATHRP